VANHAKLAGQMQERFIGSIFSRQLPLLEARDFSRKDNLFGRK
jgi:hypothetical protein